MRITEAARRLGMSPRMLRYRDDLGLLPPVRDRASHAPAAPSYAQPGAHRRFGEDELAATQLALAIEQRYHISPAALAFGLRVLTESGTRADVADLARRIGRIRPLPVAALEFEKERALRLLGIGRSARVGQAATRPLSIDRSARSMDQRSGGGRRTARTEGSLGSARSAAYRSGSR